jgi:hypothetical protein
MDDLRRLVAPDDDTGEAVLDFHASRLSWARGDGLFAPISINPTKPEYLDIAWRAVDDPPIPDNELRVASALDDGDRDTHSLDWGLRQDFIPLKPGDYRCTVRIWAHGYDKPVERSYRLHWPGAGREGDMRLMEV